MLVRSQKAERFANQRPAAVFVIYRLGEGLLEGGNRGPERTDRLQQLAVENRERIAIPRFPRYLPAALDKLKGPLKSKARLLDLRRVCVGPRRAGILRTIEMLRIDGQIPLSEPMRRTAVEFVFPRLQE